jgi:thiamine-phosphate pyrophosphorylase
MLEPTPALSRALEIARQWARWQRSAQIQPTHLLQGLLHEDEGRPWQLLMQTGLDPQLIRDYLPDVTNYCTQSEPIPGEALEEILARAHELARIVAEEGSVATEHVLLALLETDAGLRQTLESKGLQFSQLEAEVCSHGPPVQLDIPLRLDEPVDLDVGQIGQLPHKPSDILTTARVLDANANRAREALRVLEDYCRFVNNDGFLSGQCKSLRHDLASVLSGLPSHWLLQARDTEGDVGTAITVPGEMERGDLAEVLGAGCKRLQESLRSLEEYGKLLNTDMAGKMEALRYRAYTLERALLLCTNSRLRLETARLCVLVSSDLCRMTLASTVEAAAAGGAQVIQLREKNVDDRTLLERAREVRRATREAGALFILNDRPDLARLVDADGVHLGQGDLPLREARLIVGPDAVIGVSTHNLSQLRQAVLDGASYVGIGPAYPSPTKHITELAGLDFLGQAAAETSLPAFAIGGITADNVSAVIAAGAHRVAVCAAVCRAHDPRAATADILERMKDKEGRMKDEG